MTWKGAMSSASASPIYLFAGCRGVGSSPHVAARVGWEVGPSELRVCLALPPWIVKKSLIKGWGNEKKKV